MARIARGAQPSPNIWEHPQVYELENLAVDRAGVVEDAMSSVRAWHGATILDLGCGSGFHLPRFAAQAARVVGVEPHGDLVRWARLRTRGLRNTTVLAGSAQAIPLPDSSVDIVHARWAYFFGPGCEPGLGELARVTRPGGVAFVIDNDATRSTFGGWFSRAFPSYDAMAVDAFFSRNGWEAMSREISWCFDRRSDFEAVVRIEFAPDQAELILAEHEGCEVDYAVTIRVRKY